MTNRKLIPALLMALVFISSAFALSLNDISKSTASGVQGIGDLFSSIFRKFFAVTPQHSCGECQYSESKVCSDDGCSGTGTYARIVNGVCTGSPCGFNLNCGWQSGCSWTDRCDDCDTGGTTITSSTSTTIPPLETDCSDGIDNDMDGDIDCLDYDCSSNPNSS